MPYNAACIGSRYFGCLKVFKKKFNEEKITILQSKRMEKKTITSGAPDIGVLGFY